MKKTLILLMLLFPIVTKTYMVHSYLRNQAQSKVVDYYRMMSSLHIERVQREFEAINNTDEIIIKLLSENKDIKKIAEYVNNVQQITLVDDGKNIDFTSDRKFPIENEGFLENKNYFVTKNIVYLNKSKFNLFCVHDTKDIVNAEKEFSKIGETAETMFARLGANQFVGEPKKIIKKFPNDPNKIPISWILQKQLENVFLENFVDYNYDPVLASAGFVKRYDLGIVAKIDQKEAFREIVHADQLYLLISLISTLSVLVVYMFASISIGKKQKLIQFEKERFEKAFMASGIGMALVSIDGKWLKVNKSICDILQYSEAELLSITFGDVTYPEDINDDWENYQKMIDGEIDNYRMYKRYIRKDGNVIPIILTVSAVRDNYGELQHAVSQIQPIGQINDSEHKLMLDFVLRVGKVGTWTYNLTTKKTEWDDGMHQIFETNDPVNVESFLNEFLDKEDSHLIEQKLHQTFNQKVPYEIEYYIKTKKGNRKFISAVGEIFDNDKFIGVCIDLTEQKKIQEELERSNQELAKFAYITSHDLKAPLRGISTLAGWIEEDLIKQEITPSVKEYLHLMKNRTSRMEKLINGILEYSRVGRTETEPDFLDLKEELKDISKDLLTNFPNTTIKIEPNIPKIYINRHRIYQIFTNLMQNSCKYNNKKEILIEINYTDTETHHVFTIKDNGPGIKKEYHQKIFEIFQTLQSKDEIESTGIGLTLVKKIVEDLGGTIIVNSSGDNEGCEFIFTLKK